MRVFQEAFLAQPILDPNMNVTWDQDPDQGQVRKTKFNLNTLETNRNIPTIGIPNL